MSATNVGFLLSFINTHRLDGGYSVRRRLSVSMRFIYVRVCPAWYLKKH